MTRFGTSTKEEDRLDADLDLLLKGGKPEGPLGDTVERVFLLASEGGLLPSWIRMTAKPWKLKKRASLAFVHKRHWRIAMSLTSTAAVIAVVLTMAFGGMPTAFWNNTNHDDNRMQIAAQIATPDACEPIRQDTGLTGNCTSTPPPRPDNSDIVMAEAPEALTAEDCTVEPRSREEMLEVLGTLPEVEPHPILVSDTESEPLTLDNFFRGADAGVALTQDAYDGAQAAFFQWQACTTFYLTWQWAALESDARLRREMYMALISNEGPYGYLNTTEPYSEGTLNEILDGWEASEAVSRNHLAEGESITSDRVSVIDPNTVVYSADGTRLSGAAPEFVGGVDSGTLVDDGTGGVSLSVSMVLENGAWRLEHQSPGFG